jgi:hypothetical protein
VVGGQSKTGERMLSKTKVLSRANKDPRVALTTEGVTNFEGVDMTYLSAFRPSSVYSHKENYLRYLDSREWDARKRAYWQSDRYQRCWCCDLTWQYGARGFNFHHITYKNLYNEAVDDLVLLCAHHHRELELNWKHRSFSVIDLELFTYMFICMTRVELGLSLKPVMKYFKGLID